MKIRLILLTLSLLGCVISATAQEIKKVQGFLTSKYYLDEERVPRSKVESILQTNQGAYKLWQQSKRHTRVGGLALAAEFFLLARYPRNPSTLDKALVLGVGVISIGYFISYGVLKNKSIRKYNASRDTSSIKLGITKNGIGLICGF